MKAYLDIETSFGKEITVIGIFLPPDRVIQLVGEDVNWTNLWNALEGVTQVLTYNGARFDLPVIRQAVRLDLNRYFECRDLMYDCWKQNLYGGLKKVEEKLGIERLSKGSTAWKPCASGSAFAATGMKKPCSRSSNTTGKMSVNLYHLEACLERIQEKKD